LRAFTPNRNNTAPTISNATAPNTTTTLTAGFVAGFGVGSREGGEGCDFGAVGALLAPFAPFWGSAKLR
jgi:hypothetical protein